MRRHGYGWPAVLAFALTAVPLAAQDEAQTPPAASETASDATPDARAMQWGMAATLIEANQIEVELARFGAQRASNPQVRSYAADMVKEHEAAINHLHRFLMGQEPAGHAVKKTEMKREMADAFVGQTKEFLGKRGDKEFDMAFLGQQMFLHLQMAAKLEVVNEHAEGEFADFARQLKATTLKHLARAEEIGETVFSRYEGQTETTETLRPISIDAEDDTDPAAPPMRNQDAIDRPRLIEERPEVDDSRSLDPGIEPGELESGQPLDNPPTSRPPAIQIQPDDQSRLGAPLPILAQVGAPGSPGFQGGTGAGVGGNAGSVGGNTGSSVGGLDRDPGFDAGVQPGADAANGYDTSGRYTPNPGPYNPNLDRQGRFDPNRNVYNRADQMREQAMQPGADADPETFGRDIGSPAGLDTPSIDEVGPRNDDGRYFPNPNDPRYNPSTNRPAYQPNPAGDDPRYNPGAGLENRPDMTRDATRPDNTAGGASPDLADNPSPFGRDYNPYLGADGQLDAPPVPGRTNPGVTPSAGTTAPSGATAPNPGIGSPAGSNAGAAGASSGAGANAGAGASGAASGGASGATGGSSSLIDPAIVSTIAMLRLVETEEAAESDADVEGGENRDEGAPLANEDEGEAELEADAESGAEIDIEGGENDDEGPVLENDTEATAEDDAQSGAETDVEGGENRDEGDLVDADAEGDVVTGADTDNVGPSVEGADEESVEESTDEPAVVVEE